MHKNKRDQLESVYGEGKAAQEHLGHLHRSQVNERETKYIVKQRPEKSEENREHRGTDGKKVNGGTRPYEEPNDKDKGLLWHICRPWGTIFWIQ